MNSGKYNITAEFTKEVYQNELKNSDLEYNAIKHQLYFEFEVYGKKFLVGLDKILECLIIAEKAEEILKLDNAFWSAIAEKFNINYYDYDIKMDIE